MKNLYMHLTNVAIQKRNDAYDENTGMKWAIRNLKLYLNSKFGPAATAKLLGEIQVGSGSCCAVAALAALQLSVPVLQQRAPTAAGSLLLGVASTSSPQCFQPAASSSVRSAMSDMLPAGPCSASGASCRP